MKPIAIVADESVDFEIVSRLRKQGYPVYAIAESAPALSDKAVLQLAVSSNALLLTEDKDFGELVYRFKMTHCGILLLRLIALPSAEKAERTCHAMELYADELMNAFSVLDERQLRLRK